MKINEPIGDGMWAPLIVRFALGAYFVLAGLTKLGNIPGFIQEVHRFNILPDQLATLYGILLPYAEIAVGALLILGIWTTLNGIIAACMLLSYIIAIGVFPHDSDLFNKDIILLAGSLSLLYSGAGRYSVDMFRKA